jgi:hypothetical protein
MDITSILSNARATTIQYMPAINTNTITSLFSQASAGIRATMTGTASAISANIVPIVAFTTVALIILAVSRVKKELMSQPAEKAPGQPATNPRAGRLVLSENDPGEILFDAPHAKDMHAIL